ncbi:MAG: galactokinase [Treponema sp.]|jgi:galactokinase|nr:galactokinase [Treponema sp.]
MTGNELLKNIDLKNSELLFNELYGEQELDAQRKRYRTLIAGMAALPETELRDTYGGLRVFSAPGRTELGGNHTDHNNGKVLAASIQLDNAAVVQKRNDGVVFFRSTGHNDVRVTLFDSSGKPDFEPKPEEEGNTEALIRGIAAEMRKRGINADGFSANAASNVLTGSGLSSSAALEVLIGRIFDVLCGEGKLSSLEIARIGQTAENLYFKKPCGLMDQAACAAGGAVAINFADTYHPEIKRINFDLTAAGYSLCVVNTGGSHANLTGDYASIPAEMKSAAALCGANMLSELQKEDILARAAEIRKTSGDRALLRSLHFFNENERVDQMAAALTQMDNVSSRTEKQQALLKYLDLVNESGDSSWELLQNVYSRPNEQGISAALALTKEFFRKQELTGAARVHGGGFAGTVQVYIPLDAMNAYRAYIEAVFGAGSLTILRIRSRGAVELEF